MLGPFRKSFLGDDPVPELPVFGVGSLSQLEEILQEYRATVRALIAPKVTRREVSEQFATIALKTKLVFKTLCLNEEDLATPLWETANSSFTELLYFLLVRALQRVPYKHLRECVECSKFFYAPSRRRSLYCSKRCRDSVMVRRYRLRHPERYREYQRALMRRRNAEKASDGGEG